jgi:Spy/CpxP family protein refolding chaperone
MTHALFHVLSLTVSMALVGPAFAQGGFGHAPSAALRPARRTRPLAELGLTPLQRRQFNVMRKTTHAEQSRLGAQIRSLRGQLAVLYRAYPLDDTKAAAMVEQISQRETQRLRLQLQGQVELRRILTPEQFGRFTQIMAGNRRPNASPPSRVP